MPLRRNKLPRTDCYVCDREVAVRDGILVRHFKTEALGGGRYLDPVCPGSHTDPYAINLHDFPEPVGPEVAQSEEEDNQSFGITGFPQVGPPGPDQSELAQWWREIAETQISTVGPKANQYGATDLRDLGNQILDMAGRRPTGEVEMGERDAYAAEVGIAFYAMGKLARVSAAIKEGRAPSYDTWLDLAIYATMALRVHTHGGWPGLPKRIATKKAVAHLLTSDEEIEFAQEQAAAYGWDDVTLQRVLDRLRGI